MKIKIFGNSNNYPFRLVQILRKAGYDASLIVNRKELLHRPESIYPEYTNNYPDWIYDASSIDEYDFIIQKANINNVVDFLGDSDMLILNALGPSLLSLLNKPAVSFLTGSDLSYYANYKTLDLITLNWNLAFRLSKDGRNTIYKWKKFISRQRDGISNSKRVYYMPLGILPEDDKLLSKIGVKTSSRFFTYIPNPDLSYIPTISNSVPRLFCGTRLTFGKHNTKGRTNLDRKGADIMIRGIGKFYRETCNEFQLILVEKGDDIDLAKEMLEEEQISKFVVWKKEMSLREFYKEVIDSDIVFDQLSQLSMCGLVALDSLSLGRPVIANGSLGLIKKSCGFELPVSHAETSDGVCKQLKKLLFNPKEKVRLGKDHALFVKKHITIENVVNSFLAGTGQGILQRSIKLFLNHF